jgi:hypothetical protein
MPAEIFPSALRAKGMAYSTIYFITGLITPPLVQNTGYGAYVFFYLFCYFSFVWCWFFVPETNVRAWEEMDQVFKDNSTGQEKGQQARIEVTIWMHVGARSHSELEGMHQII